LLTNYNCKLFGNPVVSGYILWNCALKLRFLFDAVARDHCLNTLFLSNIWKNRKEIGFEVVGHRRNGTSNQGSTQRGNGLYLAASKKYDFLHLMLLNILSLKDIKYCGNIPNDAKKKASSSIACFEYTPQFILSR